MKSIGNGVCIDMDETGIAISVDACETPRIIQIGPEACKTWWREWVEYIAPDTGFKKEGMTAYAAAFAPFRTETREARELVERWRLLFARNASLSERYRQWTHAMRGLRKQPDEIRAEYHAIDMAFDDLAPAIRELCDDLEKWAQKQLRSQDDEAASTTK
jgi:hypothetical protein